MKPQSSRRPFLFQHSKFHNTQQTFIRLSAPRGGIRTTIVHFLVFPKSFFLPVSSSNVTRPTSYRLLSPLVSRLSSHVTLPLWCVMASPLRGLTRDARRETCKKDKRHKTIRQSRISASLIHQLSAAAHSLARRAARWMTRCTARVRPEACESLR